MNIHVCRFSTHVVIFGLLLLGAAAQNKPTAADKPAEKPADVKSAAKPAAKTVGGLNITIPDIPYTKYVLKNGLTLIVHEDHKAPIVAVNTWYHVGSKNEKPGKTGFAHLFEHLMFSGSENFNHTYIQPMESIGATNLNGTTNNDRTNYFENVNKSSLDFVLFAESDRMGHLLGVLDQKKLDLQRGVVQNEKRQGENAPYGGSFQVITENTYPVGHPYSWTVIGSMKDLDAASSDDVKEWFKTYYGPNNTVMVIAGDITPEEAKKKVEKYYGEIPAGPPLTKHTAWIAKRTGTHRGWMQDRVPQARLYRVWNVPQANSYDEAQLDLVSSILGGGKTSRLYKRLVYKDQTAVSANAFDANNEIAGQFFMTLTAKPDKDPQKAMEIFQKMEKAADEELKRFLKDGPTEAELQNAKIQSLGGYVRIMERIGGFGGKSDLLARCETYSGKPDCYKEYIEWIKAATPASLKKAANDWLSDGEYALEVQPYPTLKTDAKIDRSKEPTPGGADALSLPPMQKATLSNGLNVVVAERHSVPVVNFTMYVAGGFTADPDASPGTASMAVGMMEEGTPTRDSAKISEELEGLSANFFTGTNLDYANVSLNTLKATMDKALDIYADVILHPAYPEKEFTRVQKERVAGIQNEKVNPQAMGLRVIPALLYGKGHPYARPFTGSGNEESVKNLKREDLVKFHDTWFKPNNATLLVVGDTTLAEVTPKLEKLFAGWKKGDVPTRNVPNVPQPEKTVVYLVDRPGSGQSVIFGGQLAPPRNDPNAVAIQLVNDVFGGYFSSRNNMNLREDKHWSYGVNSSLRAAKGQRPFLTTSPVQTDKTKESLQELVKEYQGMAGAKPITADEIKSAVGNDTLSLPGNFETAGQLAGAYGNIIQYNLPEDYYNTFTQKANALTPEAANELAKKLILPDRVIWVIVGDMSKVEAGIRELNLGEVHKVDADGNPIK